MQKAGRQANVRNSSRSPRLTLQTFVDEHLEQGLVADALARRECSSPLHVRTGQSQGNLNACRPVQLPDQTRALRHFLLRFRRFLLQELASLATGPPGGLFVFVCKRGWLDRFLHGLLPSKAVGEKKSVFFSAPS